MQDRGLIFVATPLGNAKDITLRALEVLREADVLVAEDTRTLRRLMEIHGIPVNARPMLAYHDHSGERERARILEMLEAGKSVAYASEAGTPAIADPGFAMARAARAAGLAVTSAPGPSAAIAALTIAGLPTDRFLFEGFLPSQKSARRKVLSELAEVPATLVFYESPKRLGKSLADMAEVLGDDRQAAVCRELTKRFEEVRSGDLTELAAHYGGNSAKGEVVILVAPPAQKQVSEADLAEVLGLALEQSSLKTAVADVSAQLGLPRREVYQKALEMLGKN